MMIITDVARMPLKVPMMVALFASGSISPCVAVTHKDVDGRSDSVVYVVESEVTKTPENFKSHYELSNFRNNLIRD